MDDHAVFRGCIFREQSTEFIAFSVRKMFLAKKGITEGQTG